MGAAVLAVNREGRLAHDLRTTFPDMKDFSPSIAHHNNLGSSLLPNCLGLTKARCWTSRQTPKHGAEPMSRPDGLVPIMVGLETEKDRSFYHGLTAKPPNSVWSYIANSAAAARLFTTERSVFFTIRQQ